MSEIIYSSAAQLAAGIRSKKLSSLEVVEAHLQRIEEVNPAINAVVYSLADSARKQAREADAALARGEVKGPLHGVPFTIKDAWETAGVPSTGGTLGRKDYRPEIDATIVARLKAAGGIPIGMTNLPEFSMAFESDNLVHGRTNNPYDLSRTPGGSGGGGSAIIAAGGSPLEPGADMGGSIRLPSHFAGIAGIKPTIGLVPRTGYFPAAAGIAGMFATAGPMARYVEDLTYTLPIFVGPDGIDPSIARSHCAIRRRCRSKGCAWRCMSITESWPPNPLQPKPCEMPRKLSPMPARSLKKHAPRASSNACSSSQDWCLQMAATDCGCY
jgi:amidase